MATTVTYKGQTLTTVDNQTKTLQTAGTWVEGDITLTDVSGGGGIDADDIAMKNITWAIVLDRATEIKSNAFQGYAITSVTSSTVTQYGNYAFADCTQLQSADFPSLTGSIASFSFANCTNLETVNVRGATSVGGYNFQYCSKLVYLALPKITSATGARLTRGCTLLQRIDLGLCGRIDAQGLDQCPNLNVIVLRKSNGLTTLNNISAFTSTPFASGGAGGTIYIPQSLYDHLGDGTANDYKASTNWSTINGYGTITWAKIEGSYYETHYADGTVIS